MADKPPSQPLACAFAAATPAVAAVLQGRTPDALLAATAAAVRPAAMDLALTTLRDCGRGDFLLGRLLERPLKEVAVRTLLLIALARLERRTADVHTTVDQAVAAARHLAGGRYTGLVNAVLRNFGRRRDELLAAADADPVAQARHPQWWLDKLRADYPQNWPAIVAAGNSHPPLCLRVNVRRAANADFQAELAAAGMPARMLDETAFLLDKPVPVERLPGFAAGHCSVQDWGAQQAAVLLDARAGQRVLDACAAPGGKSAHLLERTDLDLTALEIDTRRAARITENLKRLGLEATVRTGDACRPADWWDGHPYDRILADVPCSASGVVRRHPDIKWLRRPEDVAGFVRTQAAILDALWPLLAPGGKMLYCTCSVFPEENAAQVRAFTARHADARRGCFTVAPGDGAAAHHEMQLLPTATHDGFYYALLEKTS